MSAFRTGSQLSPDAINRYPPVTNSLSAPHRGWTYVLDRVLLLAAGAVCMLCATVMFYAAPAWLLAAICGAVLSQICGGALGLWREHRAAAQKALRGAILDDALEQHRRQLVVKYGTAFDDAVDAGLATNLNAAAEQTARWLERQQGVDQKVARRLSIDVVMRCKAASETTGYRHHA